MSTTVTFDIASNADDCSGVRQAATWAGIGAGSYTDTTGDTVLYVDKDSAAQFSAAVSYMRWDTSSIPDTATIDSALLKIYAVARPISVGAYNLEADYYDFGGEPSVAGDWVETVAASIITPVAISAITLSSLNSFTVTDLTGINQTGFTGIRIAASAGTPVNASLECEIHFASMEDATLQAPQLEVTYTDAVAGQTLRPDADTTTTGWTTTPLFSKVNEAVADGTVITATAS